MTDWPGTAETVEPQWPGAPEADSQPAESAVPTPVLAKAATYANDPSEAFVAKQDHEGILDAFGQGFREAWGPERLGMSDESMAWFQKTGVFRKTGADEFAPFKAFNETLGLAAANAIDAGMRLPGAVFRGAQAAGVEAGMPRDIVAMPEAFFGSPHPIGIPKPLAEPKPFVRPVDIKPLEGSPNPALPRSQAALTGDPLIDAVIQHPTLRQVIDNPVVDDTHTIPNSLGGSEPMENPTLYRDKDFPKSLTVPRFNGPPIVAYRADAAEIAKSLPPPAEGTVRLWRGNRSGEEGKNPSFTNDLPGIALPFKEQYGGKLTYVDIPAGDLQKYEQTAGSARGAEFIVPKEIASQATPVDFKPASRTITFDTAEPSAIHENVEEFVIDALTANGMDQATALKVAFWEWGEPAEDAWYRAHGMDPVKVEAKYTEHLNTIAARAADDVPPDLFKGTYPDGDPAKAGPGPIDKPTAAEVARGREIMARHLGLDKEPPRTVTGGIGSPLDLRVATDLGIIGKEPSPIEGTPAEKAKAAIQPITAFHGSPYSFDAFDVGKIGEGEGAQVYGHGLYFAENKDVAAGYQKALGGKGVDWDSPQGVAEHFYGLAEGDRERAGGLLAGFIHRNAGTRYDPKVLAEAQQVLEGGKPLAQKEPGALYQVRIHADRDMMLDWDKPLNEQTPEIQASLKRAMGQSRWDEFKNAGAGTAIRQGFIRADDELVAKALREQGIPGIKYLDQGSRIDPAKAQRTFETLQRRGRQPHETAEEYAQNLADAQKDFDESRGEPTRNFVIFDHNDVEITHKNGEAVQPPAPPPQPPQPPGDGAGGGGPAAADAWRQRFDQSVGKLRTGDDVKQLIKDAADAQDDFPAARRGDVPLQHVEAIADAAGVAPSSIDARGLGRQFKTDTEVRLAYQAMLKLTEDVKTAAREHKTDPAEQSRIKLQEALMRRDMAVEQVVGFRAEWGRVGNTIQEFMERVKNQEQLGDFLNEQGRGRTPKDLDKIADAVDAMDRNGGNVPGFLNDARKPGFADKLFWYWQNQLISGWLTHTKYAAANATYLAWNRGVITPLARLMGARSLADIGHVPLEALAGVAGSISATPMAFMSALRSVKTGLRVPLEGETELARLATEKGEPAPKFAAKPFTPNQRPISGALGRIIGAPGDAANAIHTFFRIIGYEGEMQAQAYRAAQMEGHNPLTATFWDRQAQLRANATEDMMQQGIDVANKGTFIQESGPRAKAFQRFTRETPGLRWVFPFTHIPLNLMKATVEGTPAPLVAAFFKNSELGAEIRGERGKDVQHTAIARMVAGSALMGWFVNKALNGEATGDYPNDPKDRDLWKLQGKQPNSILIGNEWVSFNKFGPIGDLAGVGATMGQAIPHLKSEDGDEMEKATWYLAQAAGRIVTDEVGMMSLQMMFEAMKDDKKATTFISSMAGSFAPASSFLGQTASFMDPSMRQAKTIIDGLKYRIPGERETLLPKRDWSGQPVPNPQHGNLLRTTPAQADPVDLEMASLGIHPGPPQDRVGGVKLPPGMYDKYHATSAPLVREMLGNLVNMEGWHDLPPFVREEMFRKTIAASRQTAAAQMQMMYPQIIQQGVQDKTNLITGAKKTKLAEPALP